MNIFNSFFWKLTGVFIVVELLSLIAFFDSFWQPVIFGLVLFWVVILSLSDLRYGLYIILGELVVGGKGYLFFYNVEGFEWSIRLAIFIIVFGLWFLKMLLKLDFSWLKKKHFILVFLLLIIVLFSIGRGLTSDRQWQEIFFDVNGYLYFGLIGAFLFLKLDKEKIIRIILAGSSLVTIKSLVVMSLFSRGLFALQYPFYKWIRDTGIGEIAPISEGFFRVFFQSHFYLLLVFFLAMGLIFFRKSLNKKDIVGLWAMSFLSVLGLLISQSKSFWVAGIICSGLFLFYLILAKIKWYKVLTFPVCVVILVLVSHLAINLAVGDMSLNIFSSRLGEGNSQSGVSSRRAQIGPAVEEIKKSPLLGQGFGKKITYQSSDPRIKTEDNPDGWYSTDALELGYLDMAIDIGLLGSAFYLFLLLYIFIVLFKSSLKYKDKVGFLLGLVALVITHAFTPYLNHPLGIGYILVLINLTK